MEGSIGTNGYTCGICGTWVSYGTVHSCAGFPVRPDYPAPPFPQPAPAILSPTQGCVCPPGANLECKNPMCPRGRDGKPLQAA